MSPKNPPAPPELPTLEEAVGIARRLAPELFRRSKPMIMSDLRIVTAKWDKAKATREEQLAKLLRASRRLEKAIKAEKRIKRKFNELSAEIEGSR